MVKYKSPELQRFHDHVRQGWTPPEATREDFLTWFHRAIDRGFLYFVWWFIGVICGYAWHVFAIRGGP